MGSERLEATDPQIEFELDFFPALLVFYILGFNILIGSCLIFRFWTLIF